MAVLNTLMHSRCTHNVPGSIRSPDAPEKFYSSDGLRVI